MRLLLEARAEIDASDGRNIFPLHAAAGAGHLEAVRFLVANGAEKDPPADFLGFTPLFFAHSTGHVEIARFLVEVGADKGGLLGRGYQRVRQPFRGDLEMVRSLSAVPILTRRKFRRVNDP